MNAELLSVIRPVSHKLTFSMPAKCVTVLSEGKLIHIPSVKAIFKKTSLAGRVQKLYVDLEGE